MIKDILKSVIKKIPIRITLNQQYDYQTKKIIQKICGDNSNCIDVGCHKGEILDLIRSASPNGMHFGFEPIPDLYEALVKKYQNTNIKKSIIR